MTNPKIQRWLPWAFLALLVVAAVWWGRPLPASASLLDTLPDNGPAYRSVDLPLTPVEEKFFTGARVVKRLYRVPGQTPFVLIAIEGRENRSAMHDPSFCFRGGGWEAVSSADVILGRGRGLSLGLQRGHETTRAVYWFTDGAEQHASAARLWWQSAWHRLSRGRSGPGPVLVLLQPSNGGDLPVEAIFRWMPVLKDL